MDGIGSTINKNEQMKNLTYIAAFTVFETLPWHDPPIKTLEITSKDEYRSRQG